MGCEFRVEIKGLWLRLEIGMDFEIRKVGEELGRYYVVLTFHTGRFNIHFIDTSVSLSP